MTFIMYYLTFCHQWVDVLWLKSEFKVLIEQQQQQQPNIL